MPQGKKARRATSESPTGAATEQQHGERGRDNTARAEEEEPQAFCDETPWTSGGLEYLVGHTAMWRFGAVWSPKNNPKHCPRAGAPHKKETDFSFRIHPQPNRR